MTRALTNLKKIARLANETAGMLPRREDSLALHNIKVIAENVIEANTKPEISNLRREPNHARPD